MASGGAPVGVAHDREAARTGRALDVLVVGAGPVGLALALPAHRHGAQVHLVERRADLERPSRAMLLWPRTLEDLDRLGVGDELEQHPASRLTAHLHLGRRAVPVALSALAVAGSSRLPLMVRQADVERVLRREVTRCGIPLSTGTEIVAMEVGDQGVTALLSTHGRAAKARRCRFVVGCDGAESEVRRLAGIPWEGRTYPQEAVLADLEMTGLVPTVAHIGAGRAGVGFLFPAGEHGAGWRLVATRAARGPDVAAGRDGPAVGLPALQGVLRNANLPGRVAASAWSTRVRLQRRLGARLRAGPVLLAGDAAHVVSPAGAQGLNTGLQDAVNLGWKLAAAVGGSVEPETLLSSYEEERRPVARQVGRLTEQLLRGEGDGGQPFRSLRTVVLPVVWPLLPWALRRRRPAAAAGWVLAQGWVSYRRGALSWHGPGRVPRLLRAGRRSPDLSLVVDGRPVTLQDLCRAPGVHLLHGAAPGASRWDDRPGVRAHRVDAWPPGRVVAVRPDGYLGFSGDGAEAADRLSAWLDVTVGRPAAAGLIAPSAPGRRRG